MLQRERGRADPLAAHEAVPQGSSSGKGDAGATEKHREMTGISRCLGRGKQLLFSASSFLWELAARHTCKIIPSPKHNMPCCPFPQSKQKERSSPSLAFPKSSWALHSPMTMSNKVIYNRAGAVRVTLAFVRQK